MSTAGISRTPDDGAGDGQFTPNLRIAAAVRSLNIECPGLSPLYLNDGYSPSVDVDWSKGFMRRFSAVLFVMTVLVSAFLLFQVQPMLARYVLPWFGGTPAVWTVCMLFFQVFLFLGYAYAHALQKWFSVHWQAGIHVSLLAVALVFLPIEPDPLWRDNQEVTPTFAILMLLCTTVGIPYFLLSSTGPLLQVWFSRAHEGKSPYPLYAVSNLGSFVALLSYPIVFEPLLPVSDQVDLWSWGFASFAVLIAIIAGTLFFFRQDSGVVEISKSAPERSDVSVMSRILWIGLPACATLVLLSVTNHITQDVAAIPLLWVVPLSLYLLSFILCFESDRWYRPRPYAVAMIAIILGVVALEGLFEQNAPILSILAYNALLFVACMMCHGELASIRPGPDKLTSFYLSLAGGGALGGIFVGMVAPLIFETYLEVQISFLAIITLTLFANRHDPASFVNKSGPAFKATLAAVGALAFVGLHMATVISRGEGNVTTSRNFYGVLKQSDYIDDQGHSVRQLIHGRIVHGMQYLEDARRDIPTSYYGRTTGVGRIMVLNRDGATGLRARKIGVVGLGAGTLSAYGRAGDTIRFYEINPAITKIARTSFDYLSRTPAAVSVVEGDALITMEKEAPQNYDILVLDAFSGDAIPVHLLTEEAFAIYLGHLRDGGVISIHISNNYFDLRSVIWGLADRYGLKSAYINSPRNPEEGTTGAQWIILSSDDKTIATLGDDPWFESRDRSRATNLWTNDYSNVLKLLKFQNL